MCLSLGHPYTSQMGRILDQMLQLYRMYSDMVSKTILEGGPHAARSSFVKYMCGVKKNVLRLLEVGWARGSSREHRGSDLQRWSECG